LLQAGFTEPPESPPALVSSYLTVSPLPSERVPKAVYSLWHCPWDRSRWGLPSALPSGVRTFLGSPWGAATIWKSRSAWARRLRSDY